MLDDSVSSVTTSLLARARKLDAAAWRRLTDLYTPLIYGWARKAGLSPQDSEDIGQTVWMSVARSLFTYEHGTFRGWLRTITKNAVFDHLRSRRKRGSHVSLDDRELRIRDSGESELAQETRLLYRTAINLIRSEFSEVTWEAFWRLAVDAKAPKDVAVELGITRNQVYLAKSRVLSRIRREFGLADEGGYARRS